MNDLNNFDTISELESIAVRLKCGISTLCYMVEALEERESSGTLTDAFHGNLFYLESVQESLRTAVDGLYHARREAAR